tara:strand:+ start:7344 stop:8399 length:1056 start_codon:yes stop_codon:yes gene_type:complete
MSKKRDSKKFRKKLNRKNQTMKNHLKVNTIDWFNKNFNKVFKHEKNQKLIECMNKNDVGLSSEEKLEVFKKRNELSDEIIGDILKNKTMVKRLMLFLMNYDSDNYNKIFQQYIYLPYNVVGNKHYQKFNQFYDFISEFSLGNLYPNSNYNDEVSLFRVMDEEEYNHLLNGGDVISPSFTKNPFYLQFMRGNNTYMDINKKSIFVMVKFKLSDCIIDFVMSGENEVVIKKGSIPTFIQKYNEYDIEDVKNDLGEGVVDYLPITHDELNNGFTYMDGLIEKGYSDITKTHIKNGNQWLKITSNRNWVNQYQLSIKDVISKYGDNSNQHIKEVKEQIKQMIDLGDKVLHNPFIN